MSEIAIAEPEAAPAERNHFESCWDWGRTSPQQMMARIWELHSQLACVTSILEHRDARDADGGTETSRRLIAEAKAMLRRVPG
jgi:hypothetical protein